MLRSRFGTRGKGLSFLWYTASFKSLLACYLAGPSLKAHADYDRECMRKINMIDGTEELAEEAVKHLQALLRCETVNPPGNESTAIEYIRSQFEAEGIEYRVLAAAPGRVNIWARIRGNGTKRPLLLLSHMDVVPVLVC